MLVDDYIEYCKKYKELYNKSVVLFQVGSFYELYGTETEGANVDVICDVLQIQSTRKNKSIETIDRKNPKMGGIPLYVLDKYLDMLLEENYTIILVEQVTPPPEPKREVTRIISPSTREIEQSRDNNYLMCLYFSVGNFKNNKFLIGSISYVDVNTNDTYIFETTEMDTKLNLEDIYKTIYNNKPSELVIFTDIKTKSNTDLMIEMSKFIDTLSVSCIHNKIDAIVNENFFKKIYQVNVLQKVFINTGMLSVIEYLDLENLPLSTICYTYLLQFVYEHNEKGIEGLRKPVLLETSKHLGLVNNVVGNLNIISTNNSSGKTSSLLDLLNNCKTPIGSRYFKNCLLNPLTSITEIEERYNMCDYFMTGNLFKNIRDILSNVSDLERFFKKILTRGIKPLHFITIDKSLSATAEILNILDVNVYKFDTALQHKLNQFILYYKSRFNLNDIEKVFNKGVHEELDSLNEKILILENIFESVCYCLNEGDKTNEFKMELSSCKNKDKITRTILVTKNRFENMLKDKARSESINKLLMEKCNISLKDITSKPFSTSNKTTLKINFKNMDEKQIELINLQNLLRQRVNELYMDELTHIQNEYSYIFPSITDLIAKVDFYSNNAKNAIEKCYTRPIIKESEESYIIASKLRHPLIEAIQTDIPYVSNDIEIGTENQKGIILYGLNSVGKSSLMKSIGINVVMAQTGLYVSAKDFEFSPYHTIFTRIPSGDNIFKNQSGFMVEINELRTILKRSSKKSLVIGDELLNSTESISAISLVASGIVTLSNSRSSFIFASHLHELSNLESVKALNNVNIFHLSVNFDKKNNLLVFDRILKPGNGNVLYGLEIAKSLDLPPEFLYTANQIRQDYMNVKHNLVEPKISKYSKLVFMDTCSICNKECEEVHHIKEQKTANSNNIIEDEQIHKNRRSNLITLCEECHVKTHNNQIDIKGYRQTNEGIKLNVTLNADESRDEIKKRCIELRNKGLSYSKILNIVKDEYKDKSISLYRVKQNISR